jgi:hypothetical protein
MSNFICTNCNNSYKHKQSLYRHKKNCIIIKKECATVPTITDTQKCSQKYSQNVAKIAKKCSQNVAILENAPNPVKKTFKCSHCDKVYKHSSSKYKHQKKCKSKELTKNNELEDIIERVKNEMLSEINKKYKVHHNTFKKIRVDLEESSAKIINNTINNDNSINNNIQINFQLTPIGKENFVYNLDKETQLAVVNKTYDSINHLCQITHFNPNTPEYNSFAITNSQNNLAYMYNDKTKKYDVITKDKLLFELMHERGCDIRDFIDTYKEEIRPCIRNRTTSFLDKLETDKTYYKKKSLELKTQIYNNTKNNSLSIK